jgi:hypothetical protein
MKHLKKVILLGCVVMLMPSCAVFKQKEVMEEMKEPINCDTAEGDIRILQQEKAHVAQQVLAGVGSIMPAGIVIGIVTRTQKTKMKVAIGKYDKMIDERIAEIKEECGVE